MVTLIILFLALVPTTIVGIGIWIYWRSRKKSRVTGATSSTPLATPATAPPTRSLNWVKWGLALLVAAAVLWFFPPWKWLNWSDTVPGKAIESWLGQGWANWILWGIALMVLWLIVQHFLPSGKKGGSGLTTLGIWIVGLLLAGVLIVAVMEYLDRPRPILVDLTGKAHGYSEVVPMGFNTTVEVRGSPTMLSDGYGNHICPEAKELKKKGIRITYKLSSGSILEMTTASKQLLAGLRINMADTTFTLVKGPIYYTVSPCEDEVKE